MNDTEQLYIILDPNEGANISSIWSGNRDPIKIRLNAIISIKENCDYEISEYTFVLTDYTTIKWHPHQEYRTSFGDKIKSIMGNTAIPQLQEDMYALQTKVDKLEENMAKVVSHLETLLVVMQERMPTADPLIEL